MGHLSQALSAGEILESQGHRVTRIFAGCGEPERLPDYFRRAFGERISCFRSPGFLKSPNRKGILVNRSLLHHFLRIPVYLKEARRIRLEIEAMNPDRVFNFYDAVGALALMRKGRTASGEFLRIGIGHHFLIHLEDYPCGGGSRWHRWLLRLHTRVVMQGCDRVLALSFREREGKGPIRVIPPLIRKAFRSISYRSGRRFLVYLHGEGYLYNLVQMVGEDPNLEVDVFMKGMPRMELPAQIVVYPLDQELFREKLSHCRGLITTAGFDLAAEASFLGIPLLLVPLRNHLEQRCNGMDLERSGLGRVTERLTGEEMALLSVPENTSYIKWVNRAGELLLNTIT